MIDLTSYLTEEISSWEKIGHHALIQRFVLRNGKPYMALGPKPKPMAPKMCFCNAAQYIYVNPKAEYVEGYLYREGLDGLLFLHAWAVQDGQVIDPTIPDNENCSYFGVQFDRRTLRQETCRNGRYGLFDTGLGLNHKFMFKLDPELEAIVESIRGRRFA